MKIKIFFRHLIQLVIAVGLIYLFVTQDYAQAPRPFFTWVGWLDPFMGVVGLIQKNWPLLSLLSLGALLLAVYASRLFCGWFCPVGTVLDLLAIGKRLLRWGELRPDIKPKKYLNYIRWALFGAVAGLIFSKWLVILIMNPLVLWPREIFRLTSGLIPWSLGGIVILGLLTFPRFWCRYLCPTGSLLNLASRLQIKKYIIGAECKHCGVCFRKCPMQNIGPELQFGPDCLHCGQCTQSCPVHCITKQNAAQKITDEGRRDFLVGASVGLGSLAITSISQATILKPAALTPKRWPRLLRPPGSLGEEALATTCNRCGQCLQVCPTKALIPAGLEANLSGLWTPRFVPRRGRCMFCMACGQVCPTKALTPVPVETVRLGTPEIDHSTCLAWSKGIQCLLCVETCPKFAIQIDPQQHPVIDFKKCTGCGSCEAHCPVEGSAVILTYAGETRRNS
jgi:MauM/NapG family ferredoxin protein